MSQDSQSDAKGGGPPGATTAAQAAGTKPAATSGATEAAKTPTQAKPAAAAEAQGSDAISMLKADHRRVEALFAEYEQAAGGRKAGLIRKICQELVVHATLEEELFYPACRQAASDEDPLDEAQVEHDSAKVLIADLMRGGRGDRYRDAKVSVLAEQIRHHVEEEEAPSDGIMAKAQAAGVDIQALGQRMQARKQALQAEAGDRAPTPVSFQLSTQASQKEDQMARQGDNDRDERGRFTSDDDRGGRGGGNRGGGGRSSRDDDDRGYRSRGRDDDNDGRGWYGDSEGHSEAARRGWAERGGESRSFSRGRNDDDDRGGRNDRDRDDLGRFMSDDDDRGYRSRSRYDDDDDRRGGSGNRDRDDRGRFASDDDDRGYRSRGRDDDDYRRGNGGGGNRDRDDRGRFMSDDDDRGYRSRGRDDDRRGYASSGGTSGRSQGGWFGDSEGHSEAARRGWEERNGGGGSRARSRDDDDDRRGSRGGGSRSGGSGSSSGGSRGRSQGGWFGDSEGHAEAARRGWEDRR